VSRYILAIDQGTTSSRAILFDRAGSIVTAAQREFAQHFPRPGWVEHDAQEIWLTQAATIAEALGNANASMADVAALGIANQRETTVLWDRRSGMPVAPAIVWQDRRTATLCAQLRAEGFEAEVTRRTGLLLDPYFSGTKLAWLLDAPGIRDRARRGELAFGTVESWLIWKLTGGRHHLTDVTNASRTMLLDIRTGRWDDVLLEKLRIPHAVLPRVVGSTFDGETVEAELDGQRVRIGGAAGDQQAALLGQGCLEPGMAKNTYGTGCFLLMNTGRRAFESRHRLVTTIAWNLGELTYALEGSVFVAGAVVQWLRDGLGIIARSGEVEALARTVDGSHGVVVVPAFTGLGSPHWDAAARGLIVGLSRGTTRGHIARAALEAIAFQSAEVLAAMQKDALQPLVELRVDGGATANNLLMQFQADLLGVPVVRPRVIETTALGAALLAGLAIGYGSSPEELAGQRRVDRCFEPAMSRDEAAARMRDWSRAVERAKGWNDDGFASAT
jgi:glycerol kinase